MGDPKPMNGQDLFLEMQDRTSLLDKALEQLGRRGRTYAEAERCYRVALRQEILKERDKGTPVTVISDICRGDTEIARLKFERDVAEAVYKAAMEAVNVYKLEINIMREQIDREWNRQ